MVRPAVCNLDLAASDRRRGAAQLAGTAIRILMAVCKRSRAKDLERLNLEVEQTAFSLAESRPSMAPVRNWSLIFAHRFKQEAAMLLGNNPDQAADRAGLEATLQRTLRTLWMAYHPIVCAASRTVFGSPLDLLMNTLNPMAAR